MIKKHILLWAALAAGLVPLAALAGQIGDPAAPLTVKEWIKGKPVEVKAGTNIYVVEIFATWSLPSRACITNLNAIHKRYQDKGVVVVGISDEPVETIKQFIQGDGAKIEYAIAADNQRRTVLSYMMPFRLRGVPCVFVVGKDGHVLWYGHPSGGVDKVLDAVLAGSYELPRAMKNSAAQIQMKQYLGLARHRDPRTGDAGRVLLAARTNDVALLCDLAFQIATARKLVNRDVALATEALNQAEKLSSTNTTRVASTRAVLLFETDKKEAGLALARQAVAAAQGAQDKTNAAMLLRRMESRIKSATTN